MTRRKLNNLSNADMRKEIKRLNQRIASIGRRFGTNGETYKAAIANLMKNEKFEQYIGMSKSGFVKLDIDLRKKEVREDSSWKAAVRTAQGSLRTIGELTEKAAREIKEEKGKGYKPSASEITERVERKKYYENEMSQAYEYVYETYTDSEIDTIFPEIREKTGDRKTYKELDKILKKVEKDREKARNTSLYDI